MLMLMKGREQSCCQTANGNGVTDQLYKRVLLSLEYLLLVLDRLVTYFNHYAYCYVAIYNYGFVEASRYYIYINIYVCM